MESGTPLKVYTATSSASKRRKMFPEHDEFQPSAIEKYVPYPSRSTKQQAFDFQLSTWLIRTNMPFDHVKHEAFKELISFMDPRYTVKSPKTFSKKKIPIVYNNFKEHLDMVLTEELADVHMMGFTTDFWTCRTGDHYVNLSMHYINKDWVLKHFCVAFERWEGRTTGNDIGVGLDSLLEKIPGMKPADEVETVCVTDGAANMGAGVRESQRMDRHLVCMDHLMQTSLLHAFEKRSPLVESAIKKAKDLASHLHKSYGSTNIIKAEATAMKGEPNIT